MRFADIDWNALWREERRHQSWQGKTAADWNRRSRAFAAGQATSPFTRTLLEHLQIEPDLSILDIGCGPGNISLPLAEKARNVTAVDFSTDMLELLRKRAAAAGLENITSRHCSWEDDWIGLGLAPHDVVLCCRALAVDNLEAAIDKMSAFSIRKAILVERVGNTPFDEEIFAAVGRNFVAGPDYIFPLNLLYRKGIHASVSFFELPDFSLFISLEEAYNSCAWMLDPLSKEEQGRLRAHLRSRLQKSADGSLRLTRQAPRYAILEWQK